MIDPSLGQLLYEGKSSCLHSDQYQIITSGTGLRCGTCFFRSGFIEELPSRLSVKRLSDAGIPDLSPAILNHLLITMGLVAPEPGETLKHFRKRRIKLINHEKLHKDQYPFGSSLWLLMGFQPPLAIPLVEFCKGRREVDIADAYGWSLFNVQERLGKAVRTAIKYM